MRLETFDGNAADGCRIVEFERRGAVCARYGKALLRHLSYDLTVRFGRCFSECNLEQMRLFCLGWPIGQTASAQIRIAAIAEVISVTRHFYRPQPVCTPAEISADIRPIEKEAAGLLDGVSVEAPQP